MVHQEDAIHRVYYALHIGMSFVMGIAIEHPDYTFFNFKKQSFFLSMASILTRMVTVFMWLFMLWNDHQNRNSTEFKPGYDRNFVRRQIPKHVAGIMASCLFYAIACGLDYNGDPDDETRRRLASTAGGNLCDGHRRRLGGAAMNPYDLDCANREDYTGTIVLWTLAVVVEQATNTYCCIYDRVRRPCLGGV